MSCDKIYESYLLHLKEVDGLVDRLGAEIDPLIKHPVTSLRMAGFPTFASCQGHMNKYHGLPYPWIDVGTINGSLKDNLEITDRLENTIKSYHASHGKHMFSIRIGFKFGDGQSRIQCLNDPNITGEQIRKGSVVRNQMFLDLMIKEMNDFADYLLLSL